MKELYIQNTIILVVLPFYKSYPLLSPKKERHPLISNWLFFYDLILKNFLSCFCNFVISTKKISKFVNFNVIIMLNPKIFREKLEKIYPDIIEEIKRKKLKKWSKNFKNEFKFIRFILLFFSN